MNYRISSWDSETHEGLNKQVNDFLIDNDVQVTGMSFSSVWNPKKGMYRLFGMHYLFVHRISGCLITGNML